MSKSKSVKEMIVQHLDDELLAIRWKCSESFVRKERKGKRLPYIKIGRNVRIKLEDVIKYEEERKVS